MYVLLALPLEEGRGEGAKPGKRLNSILFYLSNALDLTVTTSATLPLSQREGEQSAIDWATNDR